MTLWTLTPSQKSLIFGWGLIIKSSASTSISSSLCFSGLVVVLLPPVQRSHDRRFQQHPALPTRWRYNYSSQKRKLPTRHNYSPSKKMKLKSSNQAPTQPSLQRPGSAAPHLQVPTLTIIFRHNLKSHRHQWLFAQMIHGPPQALRSSDLIDVRRSDLVDGLRNHFDPMSQSQISESNTGAINHVNSSVTLIDIFFIWYQKSFCKVLRNRKE